MAKRLKLNEPREGMHREDNWPIEKLVANSGLGKGTLRVLKAAGCKTGNDVKKMNCRTLHNIEGYTTEIGLRVGLLARLLRAYGD